MATLDDEIARHLREAAAAGELSKAEGYGKPEEEDWTWDATPAALRMPFKVLKDAGYAPPEILLFQERAQLTAAVRDCADETRMREFAAEAVSPSWNRKSHSGWNQCACIRSYEAALHRPALLRFRRRLFRWRNASGLSDRIGNSEFSKVSRCTPHHRPPAGTTMGQRLRRRI